MKDTKKPVANQRLRDERERRGWSRLYLATQLNLADPKTIGRWERGAAIPNAYFRKKLSALFELEEKDLGLSLKVPSISTFWHVPYQRNGCFTGRQELLEHLYCLLAPGKKAAPTQVYALHGLGGIGKTQIALEYSYRYAHSYTAIFWIAAESAESITASFLRIAEHLGLPEYEGGNQDHLTRAVQHWLNNHQGWLLIWDNVEDVALLGQFLPTNRKGSILLTTRHRVMGTLALGLEIASLSLEESLLFLLRRARLLAPHALPEQVSQFASTNRDTYTAACELVELLGRLPLALDQVGAYIEETCCSLVEYAAFYRERRGQLLQRRGTALTNHPESVATTWSLSFERIEQINGAAADLLRICAYLHPDSIPVAFFTTSADHLGERLEPVANDPLWFNEVIGALHAHSLVYACKERPEFTLHRLVQAVQREMLDTEAARQWMERAVIVVSNALPDAIEDDQWFNWQQVLPQALACSRLIQQEHLTCQHSRKLLYHTGIFLGKRAQYSQAEAHLEHLHTILVHHFSADLLSIARTLRELAIVHINQSNYAQAEEFLTQALSLFEHTTAPNHLDIARTLSNLALLTFHQGKHYEAEAYCQRAIQIKEQVGETNDLHFASILTTLLWIYDIQGKYDQAGPLQRRALSIRETLLGPEHPLVAESLNSLAILYFRHGKYTDSEPLLHRALAIEERISEHFGIAITLNNLGWLAYALGRYEQSRHLCQRSLQLYEKSVGETHPYVAVVLRNLARALAALGDAVQAEQYFLRSYSMCEKQVGPDNAHMATIKEYLAAFYLDQGNAAQADPLVQSMLTIREQVLGNEHVSRAQSLRLLARLYVMQGHEEQAGCIFGQAQAILEQKFGSGHPDLALILIDQADLLRRQQRNGEAETLYKQAKQILQEVLSADHPSLSRIRDGLTNLTLTQKTS